MTKLSFLFATTVANVGCLALASPAHSLSFAFPHLQLPAPPIPHISPLVKMPALRASTAVEFRVEIGAFCGGVFEYQEPTPLGLIELFGSVEDFRQALASDLVEVVELRPSVDFYVPSAEHLDRVVKLPSTDAAVLRAVLTCDSAFDWRDILRPESRADFRVKFKSGGREVALDLFLAARAVRLVKGDYVGPAVSLEFGSAVVAEIVEHYFPGAIDGKG